MAEKTVHVVEEQIKFATEGSKEALKAIKDLQKALNDLEKSDSSKLVEKRVAEETRKKQQAVEDQKAKVQSKAAKGSGVEGVFSSSSLLKFQLILRSLEDVARMLDGLTRPMRDLNKQSLMLAATTDRLATGWGWTAEGQKSLTKLSDDLEDHADVLGTVPSTIMEIMKGYTSAGVIFDDFAADTRRAAVSASDNAFLLYGSFERLGDAVQSQAEFMDQFRYTVHQADRAIKSIILDAHSAGIATERFFGAVKDTSAELDLYAGQMEQVSNLMAAFGANLGAFRGLKEGKELISILNDLTREQKVFMLTGRKNLEMARKFTRERLEAENTTTSQLDAQIKTLEKRRDELKAKGAGEADVKVVEADIRKLRGQRMESLRIENLLEATSGGKGGPITLEALADVMGPLPLLQTMLESLGGEGGIESFDFRDASLNLEKFATRLGGLLGDASKGGKLATYLQALQGDQFENIGEALRSISKEDADALNQLANPQTEQERARKILDSTKSILDQIYQLLERIMPEIATTIQGISELLEAPMKFIGNLMPKDVVSDTSGSVAAGESDFETAKKQRAGSMQQLFYGVRGAAKKYILPSIMSAVEDVSDTVFKQLTGGVSSSALYGRNAGVIGRRQPTAEDFHRAVSAFGQWVDALGKSEMNLKVNNRPAKVEKKRK